MTYRKFVDNIVLRRTTVLLALILLLWLVRSVMSTILLTFIFSFLVINPRLYMGLVRVGDRVQPD